MHNKILRMILLAYLLLFAIGCTLLSEQQLVLASDLSKYPVTIRINADGKTVQRLTFKKTLLDAIDESGVALGETDQINLPEDTPLLPGQCYEVTISRLSRVTLSWNGYAVGTTGDFTSLTDLLSRSGYSTLDLSNGSRIENNQFSSQVNDDIYLAYVLVEKRIVKEYETIPFSTITIDDATLYVGQSVIKTKGKDGQRALIFEETYENGVFIKSEQTGSEIVKEPIQQVIRKGIKKRFVFAPIYRSTLKQTVLSALNKIRDQIIENGGKCYASFKDNGNGTITVDGKTFAYTSMKKRTIVMYDGLEVCLQNGCHDPPINHNTFSGVPAQRGIVAVAGKKVNGKFTGTALPMGTILFVEGYGLGVVGDVNGAKTNLDLIDVCYNAGEIRDGIANLGKSYSRVYILKTP
jgi:uncharacterized protein YabE (DUF348 family)/3D (Asp-Asp-Asp) domain-containing protein